MANPIDGSGRPASNPMQDARDSRQLRETVSEPNRGDERNRDAAAESTSTAGESERLQSLREAVDQTPEVDRGRVDALREQIANGEYPLNAESIADRFAELEGLLEG